MKKLFRAVCAAVLALCMVTESCGCKNESAPEKDSGALTVLIGNNDTFDSYLSAITEKFPDIELDIEYYSGPNTTEYFREKITNGEAPDIIFSTQIWNESFQKEYLLDISGYSFMDNFNTGYLTSNDVDGAIYIMPTPYTIIPLLYNKTLFEEMGWSVPTNHEEFIALIKQIRAESDITPVTITGRFAGTSFRILSTLAQCDFLSTVDGIKWKNDFINGHASAEEGFGDALNLLKDWIDAGAFSADDYDNRDGDTYTNLLERKAAIAFALSNLDYFAEKMESSTDEFGAIPFFGLTDSSVMLTSQISMGISLGKQLKEPENSEKLSTALKIMEYLSTEEGQQKLSQGEADIIPLKGITGNDEFTPYNDIWKYVDEGRTQPYIYTDFEEIVAQSGAEIKEACFRGGSLDNLLSNMDELKQSAIAQSGSNILSHAESNFTHEQTVSHILDFLLEQGGGDIAIVSDGGYKNGVRNRSGVSGKIFEGEISVVNYNVCLPGDNTANLVNFVMTGSQIAELIENGRTANSDDESLTAVFDYYVKGLTYDIVDGKVQNAKLADGTELDPDKQYRVSMAGDDLTNADTYTIEDSGLSIPNAYMEYLKNHQTISVD
jgi:ABC-type glycerol-3-phosphate transport system substrate-binding protein